jgi:hypothetical protein
VGYECVRNGSVRQEYAEHEALRTGGARRDDPGEALAMKLFPNRLERWPAAATWCWLGQPHVGQAVCGAQIGDFDRRDLVGPQLAREANLGRNRALGEMAIPLGPYAFSVLAQVQRVDHAASLPAVVIRRRWAEGRVDTRRRVPKPPSLDDGQLDIERHRR